MRILAIETSSPRLSLALGTERGVLKEYNGPHQWRHAESLFEGMERLLEKTLWPVRSLTGVLVSTGPGSFTGIRIGLAAARAIGQALKVPVAGVSSLETLGRQTLRPGEYTCPLIDALRGDVFTAIYRMDPKGGVKTILKECRLPLSELIKKLKPLRREPLRLAGDAAVLYRKDLKSAAGKRWRFAAAADGSPRAGTLLKLGSRRLLKAGASYDQVVPLYLRSAAAVERRRV